MTMLTEKEERLAAINRMKMRRTGLLDEAKKGWDATSSTQIMRTSQLGRSNQMKNIQDLQAIVVKATQADMEAKEIQRFIDRAVQTYVRDYPQFGRGTLR